MTLHLRGGAWGAGVILALALALLIFAATHQSKIEGYVVAFLIPVLATVLLATDEKAYGEAVVLGLSKPMFAIIALAVLFASISGKLIRASGLIETLVGLAMAGRLCRIASAILPIEPLLGSQYNRPQGASE